MSTTIIARVGARVRARDGNVWLRLETGVRLPGREWDDQPTARDR
jgi:hypothetical protein